MLSVNLETGKISFNEEVKSRAAERRPYAMLMQNSIITVTKSAFEYGKVFMNQLFLKDMVLMLMLLMPELTRYRSRFISRESSTSDEEDNSKLMQELTVSRQNSQVLYSILLLMLQ